MSNSLHPACRAGSRPEAPLARRMLRRAVQSSTSFSAEPAQPRRASRGQALPPRATAGSDPEDAASSRAFSQNLAVLGLGAALLSERLNGMGVVQQLELHDELAMMHPILLASVAGLTLAAIWPSREAPAHAAPGPLGLLRSAAGRLSYAGLAGTIAAELYTGKGFLALLDVETGVEVLTDIEALAAFLVMLVLTGPGKQVPE